jgi:molybdopterin-containing oxidoreductase family membrane subunit
MSTTNNIDKQDNYPFEAIEEYVDNENSLESRIEISKKSLSIHTATSKRFRQFAYLTGAMLILGIVGFFMKLFAGFDDKQAWGYYVAVFAFLMTTTSAAPMVAIAPRIANAHWRRPISRAAEIWTLAGCVNLILYIPLIWLLPSLENGRRSLWFYEQQEGVPAYAPHIWVTLAIIALVILGVALTWVSCLPDFALLRDHATGWRQRWGKTLSLGWLGTTAQWNWQYHRMGIIGAFYFMMLVFVHFFISVEFLMVHVPGWIDSLYPITHAHNALQGGVATVMLTMFFLRQFGGYKEHIGIEQFWALGKLLLALSLLWFWFWFCSFQLLWYGKKPTEVSVLELLVTGPYRELFISVFLLVFIIPWFTMIWNPIRRSIWGPTIIAVSVLIGTFLDRIRLYVGAWDVASFKSKLINPDTDMLGMELAEVPNNIVMPGMADIFLTVGFIGGSIFIYLLATRIIPAVNIWEKKEFLLYKAEIQFHRVKVIVLGKPR